MVRPEWGVSSSSSSLVFAMCLLSYNIKSFILLAGHHAVPEHPSEPPGMPRHWVLLALQYWVLSYSQVLQSVPRATQHWNGPLYGGAGVGFGPGDGFGPGFGPGVGMGMLLLLLHHLPLYLPHKSLDVM